MRNLQLIDLVELSETEEHDPSRVKELAKKIVNLGKWTLPVAVEYSSLFIMDGHHRFNAGKSIGLKRIPCYLLDYSSSGISLKSWRPDWDIKVSDVFKLIKSGKKFPKKTTRHLFDPPLDEVSIPLTLLF